MTKKKLRTDETYLIYRYYFKFLLKTKDENFLLILICTENFTQNVQTLIKKNDCYFFSITIHKLY